MASVSFHDNGSSTPTSPDNHHHSHLRIGKRLQQLFHPDGRRFRVVSSPEEAQKLRLTSSNSPDEAFDVIIHGSPEHHSTLKEIHSHYDGRRAELRRKHGQVFTEFERVQGELDVLAGELETLTDHDISLDANFSKYGYSAHIRTHDHHSSGTSSSSTSLYGDSRKSSATDFLDAQGNAMELFVKPIVRQYHHKGVIWRAPESQEVRSYELFFDLIYVGIIAISGDSAAEEATGEALLRFAITFILGWRIWTDVVQFVSWFDADDIYRRVSVLFLLVCLLGLTTNMVEFLGETYTAAISFYLAARLFTGLSYVLYAFMLPMVRGALLIQILAIGLSGAVWIGSTFVEDPQRQALIWIAIIIDLFSHVALVIARRFNSLRAYFDFHPAINIEHRIERTNAFVSLVFGYSVVSLLYQSAAQMSLNAYFGKACLGLIQAYSFNWLYFEVDSFNLKTHAIRRSVISSLAWFTAHLPMILSFVLAGAALARIVLVHDIASVAYLDSVSSIRSDETVATGQRWFYCAGLGIALLCMNAVSLTHEYKVIGTKGSLSRRFNKNVRLGYRSCVGVVLILLSLADGLDSIQLVATTSCLIVSALALELYANTYVCVESKACAKSRMCSYTARCRMNKRDLEQAVKDGTISKVEELDAEKRGIDLA